MTDKFKPGKPDHEGWWRYRGGPRSSFKPVKVFDSKAEGLYFLICGEGVNDYKKYILDTFDDQWAGEIEMPG